MPLVASGQFTITDSADNINMILSSDSFIVATNSDGSNGNYSNCVCRLKVLHGFLDETSKWTFSVGTPVGLTGVLSSDTYTVSGATLDSSTVDITATRSGYPSITKRLTVVKAKAGATGAQGAQGVQGPTVTITANRALSFTATDGTLDASQTNIVFTAATTGITSPTYAWSFTGLQTNPTASTTTAQTITAAQFGTSNSATVTCTVGTYKETLTIVRLEKSTAAAGATVGATWGTNVSSIPSNISTAGSTPTIDLRNNQIGLNASGQLYGAGAGNGTTVSNAQISVDTATGVIGGIGTGAGTAVANSQVAFSARQTWEFRGSAEGWVAGAATLTTNADTITLAATGIDSTLGLGGLNINGSVYDKLRMRVRRVGGSGWDGKVYFATSPTSPNTHHYSESYCKVLPNSLLSTSFVMLEWDMANLTVGGNNWTASTITAIRLDLGSTASDVFEIDWISVGKYGHDVDLVLSASSQIIAGTETNGVILDAASKSLQVVTDGNERVRLGNQAAAVNGSAYGFVVKDNGGNVVFDSRNAVGIVGNQAHDNYNLGDSTTNPFWNTNTNGVGNVAIGALALCGDGLAEASGRSFNVAIGYQALRYTTVGTNIAIGYQAGRGNPAGFSGGDNTVIGYNAMVYGTTANKNVAIGRGALRDTTSGSENTAVGYLSQSKGDIASYNTSLGYQSIRVATGSENTSFGHNSGYSLSTGSNNTFVGKDAGYTITTGSGNTFIGYKAYTSVNQNNQTIIASGAGVVLKHSGSLLETSHSISSGGNITATGTVKGSALTVEGSEPTILLLDTDAAQSNFWIHANSSKFYVLTDYDFDGSWDTPYPLVLDNATTTANIYGQKAWTAGNDGAGSGLDADTLDGYQAGMTNVASTVAVRDGSGDIHTRLIRSEFSNETTISGAMAYRVESTSGGNNYVRFCSDTDAIKSYLGVKGREVFGGYYPASSAKNIDDASAGDVGLYSKTGGGTWPSSLVSEFAWVETQKMYAGNASVQHAVEYTGTGTPTGEQWFRTRSNAAAPYVWSTWKRVVTDGNIHAVLNNPKNGDWFNGGYMSIRSDGVMNAGKYLDWHNTGADTAYTGRTTVDSTGLLTHSEGLKVKGTGGLGYAFGGAVTQLTSRDTGVTLNTPSGTIALFSTTVTAGTMNKFTLTNSCIQATDVVVVGVRASNSGTFNVFVNRTTTGVCDIVVQNLVTVATAQAVHINFAIIKGANA